MKTPRIVIAGTNSGCGKTTITTGIMAALVKRGLKIQPFKVGPDYIDPMFHTFITGSHSRNLDSWMLTEDIVTHLFCKNAQNADISVIEGVMGIYDGFGGYSQTGSTAHVAKLIKAPLILVVNGEGMSLSIVALIRGFMDFDREISLKGVIINNIKSESHFKLLKDLIEENTGVRVVGYLNKMSELSLQSRHLGLVPSGEVQGLKEKINLLSESILKTIDIELLLKIANEAGEANGSGINFNIAKRNSKFTIAVAYDKAFNFYYKDNLDLLEAMGAELCYFSPLNDTKLPDDIHGLYIGGGYPEVPAEELERNTSVSEDIKKHIMNGIPAYAECGGLMYLSESIKDREGRTYKMVGVIPGKSEMTQSLQRFGYVEVEAISDSVLSRKGYKIRAHEFHYSTTTVDWDIPTCFKVVKKKKDNSQTDWTCGFKVHNLLAGYPHLHFWSNTGFAERFVNQCIQYRSRKVDN